MHNDESHRLDSPTMPFHCAWMKWQCVACVEVFRTRQYVHAAVEACAPVYCVRRPVSYPIRSLTQEDVQEPESTHTSLVPDVL
jgi:hypothetical protein